MLPNTTESAIASVEPESMIRQSLQHVLGLGKDIHFVDGMESPFSQGLIRLIQQYGNSVVEELGEMIFAEEINSAIAGEALRWVGQMQDTRTYTLRKWLLERCLLLDSIYVKDGAILGLASLDDPRSITSLKYAIEHETNQMLKEDMLQVLDQLQDTSLWI